MILNPTQTPFLTSEESQMALLQLKKLEQHWRNPLDWISSFSCLGLPSYTYSMNGKDIGHYLVESQNHNPILFEEFGWLLNKVLGFLSNYLGEKVSLNNQRFSLPGFHVFLADERWTREPDHFHTDTQFLHLPWKGTPDYQHPLTFTVSLEAPRCGAQLEWKRVPQSILRILDKENLAKKLAASPTQTEELKMGMILLQDGLHFHRIRPWSEVTPTDRRITFQGHLLRVDGSWQAYW